MALGDKFAIGYVSYGMNHDEFTQSLYALGVTDMAGPRRIDRGRTYKTKGPYLAQNRADLARMFIANTQVDKTPWLLMLDTDTFFEVPAIYDLIDSADEHERPIITGAQFGYVGNGGLTLIWGKKQADGRMTTVDEVPDDLMELDWCGMGICAIHRTVFERMMELHPDDDWNTFGHDSAWNPELKRTVYLGEDITFCLRAKALGFSIWGNPFVEVDHMKVGRQNKYTREMKLDYDLHGTAKPIDSPRLGIVQNVNGVSKDRGEKGLHLMV